MTTSSVQIREKRVIELNITIVCEGFDQSSLSLQPWRRVYEISRRITKRSISVTVISDRRSDQPETEEIDGVQIIRIRRLTLAPIIKKRELLKVIRRNRPDVVILYGTLLSALYLTRLRSIGAPLIWDIEAGINGVGLLRRLSLREVLDPHHTSFLLKQAFMATFPQFFIRSVANSALISRIIVPGQYLRESLCKLGVRRHKIAIMPSGVEICRIENSDISQSNEEHRGELRAEARKFTVTYMGSPCTLRGTETIIQSVKKIVGRCKNLEVVILSRRDICRPRIGNRHLSLEEDYLKELVGKLQVEDRVEIVSGILGGSDLRKYVFASDVIALPFKMMFSEPPLSVFEVMRLGKVVVTTNIGVLTETIGEDKNARGILIEPGDSDALAHAIIFLSEHPKESARIGSNAQRFVSSFSTWDDLASKFVDLLKEVVKEA